jgi:hypothetical protein
LINGVAGSADDVSDRDQFMRGDGRSHDDHQLLLQIYHSEMKELGRNAGGCERRWMPR